MGSEAGYDRGFEEFFEPYYEMPPYASVEYLKTALSDSERRGPLLRELLREIRYGPDSFTSLKFDLLKSGIERSGDRPVFGMANLLSTHRPYDPPRPYKTDVTPELERSQWYLTERLFGLDERLNDDDVREEHVFHAQTTEGLARYMGDPDYLTDAELEVLQDWYRGGIRYVDAQLDPFIECLEREGTLDETVLIVTADHGEFFGEHGLMLHNNYLYDEVRHVPLIVRGPGVPESDRRTDFVSLIDIFDTVCDLIDHPVAGTELFVQSGSDEQSEELRAQVQRLPDEVSQGDTVTLTWDADDAHLLTELSVVPGIDLETDLLGE